MYASPNSMDAIPPKKPTKDLEFESHNLILKEVLQKLPNR